jgi:ribosome-associated translation inhibitor RaiA
MKAGNKVQLQIRCSGIANTEEVREFVRRRLRFALGRLDGAVSRISVRLLDVNGPKGGDDKVCKMIVRTSSGGNVIVEETHADLFAAVSKAADRAGRLAGTQISLGRAARRFIPPIPKQDPMAGTAS